MKMNGIQFCFFLILLFSEVSVFHAQELDENLSGNKIDTSSISNEDIEKIVLTLSKKIKENPTDAKLIEKRATAFLLLKRYDLAIRDYDNLIRQDSQNGTFYYGRGLCKLNMKQVELACIDFKKARRLGYSFKDKDVLELCEM